MTQGFGVVAEEREVEELRLTANGLRVLLLPDPSVPVATACIVYHVGSRNEGVGHTGATHLLEHLLFKGSRKFNSTDGTSVARVLERVGAAFNATTWLDRTSYYETLPSEHLELALEIEADRMRHALLREEDLASEMTVVRNELERSENEPFDLLLRDSFATAFREHPYHHPTIGWRADIENASIERLREFYDTFYHPDNATLVLAGTFEREKALTLVERHFGPLPRAPRPIPRVVTTEPRQQGERRFTIRRAGEVGWIGVSWHVPAADHVDTHALAVAADALAGGVTSRLYQRLVENGKCLDVQAVSWQLRDPGLFQVFATLAPGSAHAEVEETVRSAIAELAAAPLPAVELERAKAQVEVEVAFHRDSPAQVAAAVAEAVSAADWRFYRDYPEHVGAVSGKDVSRVVAETFIDDNTTVGWFVPRNGSGHHGHIERPGPCTLRPAPCHFRTTVAERVVEARLGCGIRVLMLPRHSNNTVHLQGSLLAGHGLVPANDWSVASLIPDMLERGTQRMSRLELAGALEDRGIDLDISGEAFNPLEVFLCGRCLARHLPVMLGVLLDMLRRPSFPADELEKVRELRLGELKQANEDTFMRAFEAVCRLLYPPSHPHHRRTLEERRAGVSRIQRGDLMTRHGELYGPATLLLVLVGDFEPAELVGRLEELTAGWSGGAVVLPELERRLPATAAAGEMREQIADKPNLDVVLANAGGLRRRDDDFVAAMLGNAVLGQSTLSSRLGRRLRDTEGLTYGIVSRFFGASLVDGPWLTTFSVSLANLERAVALAREEIARFVAEGPDEEELQNERLALAGSYRVSLATPGGMARELARLARHDLSPGEMDKLPERILGTSREAVVAAIKRHIDPASLSLSVAGDLGK